MGRRTGKRDGGPGRELVVGLLRNLRIVAGLELIEKRAGSHGDQRTSHGVRFVAETRENRTGPHGYEIPLGGPHFLRVAPAADGPHADQANIPPI